MRIENAVPGMVLDHDIVDERGSLLLEKGITLTASYIEHLKNLHISIISVADNPAGEVKTHPAISLVLRNEIEQNLNTLFTLQQDVLFNYKLLGSHLDKLHTTMHNLIDELDCNPDNLINTQVCQLSLNDVKHAANVCLMSVITGLYLKFSRPMLHNLALGALLHDLGKTLLFTKKRPDTKQLHTLLGRHLLMQSSINPAAALIAAQHHENFNGSGMPLKLAGKEIHPLARIVRIADYYDRAAAMAEGSSLNDTVETMLSTTKQLFDPNMLKAFFNTIAVYPVGSLVRLSNQQKAYVTAYQPHAPLRPKVSVRTEGKNTELDLLFQRNLTIVELIQ